MTEATGAKIRNSETIIMQEIGHFPMCENPEVFKKYLMPVLARIVDADRDRRPSAHSAPSGRVEYNFSSNREDSLSRKPSSRW
jgi:hypothetical protein